MAALQRLALRGTPKATKKAARYIPAGGAERCGMCRHYVPSSSCARIEGPVSAAGWCMLYSQQVTWRPRAGQLAGLNPGLVPPGVTLDLSFMSAGTLDPRVTFTRASTATYFDATGTMRTAATNTPRWDTNGLLLEEARTNVLLNSATLGTQSVTVTAQAYTLSFYGTGTVTKSGTASGALVGTGAAQRVSQTFTPTAGTLTLTVTGTVTNAQLEAGAFLTSYIPTTAAAATRAYDLCVIPPANMSPWFASPGGSWMAEFINSNTSMTGYNARIVGANTPSSTAPLYEPAALVLSQYDGAGPSTANFITANAVSKGASTWAPGTGQICLNGSTVQSGTMSTGYAACAASGVGLLAGGSGVALESMTGYLRRVRYWPRVLSAAELQSVTT